jgi:hypothetical protein
MNECTLAARILEGYVSSSEHDTYLWADSIAVCTLLGLAREMAEPRYEDQVLQLIDKVHQTLGKHRSDDTRTGWLSGANDDEGALHPTVGNFQNKLLINFPFNIFL